MGLDCLLTRGSFTALFESYQQKVGKSEHEAFSGLPENEHVLYMQFSVVPGRLTYQEYWEDELELKTSQTLEKHCWGVNEGLMRSNDIGWFRKQFSDWVKWSLARNTRLVFEPMDSGRLLATVRMLSKIEGIGYYLTWPNSKEKFTLEESCVKIIVVDLDDEDTPDGWEYTTLVKHAFFFAKAEKAYRNSVNKAHFFESFMGLLYK